MFERPLSEIDLDQHSSEGRRIAQIMDEYAVPGRNLVTLSSLNAVFSSFMNNKSLFRGPLLVQSFAKKTSKTMLLGAAFRASVLPVAPSSTVAMNSGALIKALQQRDDSLEGKLILLMPRFARSQTPAVFGTARTIFGTYPSFMSLHRQP